MVWVAVWCGEGKTGERERERKRGVCECVFEVSEVVVGRRLVSGAACEEGARAAAYGDVPAASDRARPCSLGPWPAPISCGISISSLHGTVVAGLARAAQRGQRVPPHTHGDRSLRTIWGTLFKSSPPALASCPPLLPPSLPRSLQHTSKQASTPLTSLGGAANGLLARLSLATTRHGCC